MEDSEVGYCEVIHLENDAQPTPRQSQKKEDSILELRTANTLPPRRIPAPRTHTVLTSRCTKCDQNSSSIPQVAMKIAVVIIFAILSLVFMVLYFTYTTNVNWKQNSNIVTNCSGISHVYFSCSDALQNMRNAQNGIYRLRDSSNSYTKTFCQMTSLTGCNGGGWTLVMKTDGSKEAFKYSSTYWENKQSYNPVGGLSGLDDQETKLSTYWSTSFKELCVGMKVGNDIEFLSIRYPASSLYDLIADGKYRATSLGRQKWKSLISGSSLQRNCNKEGFNVAGTYKTNWAKARIGLIGNEQNECLSPDSYLGFGGLESANRRYFPDVNCGVTNVINTCGNSATCTPDNGVKEIKAIGYIFVR